MEERNAVCMTCGRVSPISERKTFEDLAVMFEGSTASGAERAYRKAVEKLTALLVEAGALHAARLKRESVKRAKKKIAAAVYEYQADCDGEWGYPCLQRKTQRWFVSVLLRYGQTPSLLSFLVFTQSIPSCSL